MNTQRTCTGIVLSTLFLSALLPAAAQQRVDYNFEDEGDIPKVVENYIANYVDTVFGHRNQTLRSMTNALSNFETAMNNASAKDAQPRILDAMVKEGFKQAVNATIEKVPGLSYANSLYAAAATELERAGKAMQSYHMGSWIIHQRNTIDDLRRQDTQKARNDLKTDLGSDYLEMSSRQRDAFFDGMRMTIQDLGASESGPSVYDLTADFYEKWINAHYDERKPYGVIRYNFKADGERLELDSCTVQAPSGDKVSSALNHILNEGRLSSRACPLDFRVRKEICLYTDLPFGWGSRGWDCGILGVQGNSGPDNRIRAPLTDNAKFLYGNIDKMPRFNRFKDK